MTKGAKTLLAGVTMMLAMAVAGPSVAADITYEPPIVEAPPVYEIPEKVSHGGWYIRGDIDYHAPIWRGGDYIVYPPGGSIPALTFNTGSLRPAFSIGGGVGYKVNKYFRADFTADYWFRSTFTGTTGGACGTCYDTSNMSALLLMANAYAHLGKWGRWSPYVGAGIGGARIKWDDLSNTPAGGVTVYHPGSTNWRFAWAAMVGTTVCLTDKLDLDVGYRYTRVSGGRMFEYDGFVGPGRDFGFNVHEGRAGLRYKLGGGKGFGNKGCGYKPEPIAYEPMPIDPPIYK